MTVTSYIDGTEGIQRRLAFRYTSYGSVLLPIEDYLLRDLSR